LPAAHRQDARTRLWIRSDLDAAAEREHPVDLGAPISATAARAFATISGVLSTPVTVPPGATI
jgi:hypothetical protein